MTEIRKLADEILAGRRLTRQEECLGMVIADLAELSREADRIREKACGNRVSLCAIINGRSGRCSEDCKFCAQAKCNATGVEEYGFLDPEEIVEDCKKHERRGINRYSIVTAGRTLAGKDLDTAVEAYRRMHEECPGIALCASHGLVSAEGLRRLKEAGATRYHCNLESSRRYFAKICSTHTYDDKIREIRMAQEAGMEVCSGGIIGMGEAWEDRIDMALTAASLGVRSIPINVLRPIPGTPLEHVAPISNDDVVRTVAMFRFIAPEADIRIAAGRNAFSDGGRVLFQSGSNATITGDMLTTTGCNISQDRQMFTEMGWSLLPESAMSFAE